ncbi:MAG TPA: hypothetical protein VIQ53_02640, partial [Inquilinus sp.]
MQRNSGRILAEHGKQSGVSSSVHTEAAIDRPIIAHHPEPEAEGLESGAGETLPGPPTAEGRKGWEMTNRIEETASASFTSLVSP